MDKFSITCISCGSQDVSLTTREEGSVIPPHDHSTRVVQITCDECNETDYVGRRVVYKKSQ